KRAGSKRYFPCFPVGCWKRPVYFSVWHAGSLFSRDTSRRTRAMASRLRRGPPIDENSRSPWHAEDLDRPMETRPVRRALAWRRTGPSIFQSLESRTNGSRKRRNPQPFRKRFVHRTRRERGLEWFRL